MLGTLTPASSSPCQGQTQSMPREESESGHMRIYQSMCVELKNNCDLSCQKSSSQKWFSRPFIGCQNCSMPNPPSIKTSFDCQE